MLDTQGGRGAPESVSRGPTHTGRPWRSRERESGSRATYDLPRLHDALGAGGTRRVEGHLDRHPAVRHTLSAIGPRLLAWASPFGGWQAWPPEMLQGDSPRADEFGMERLGSEARLMVMRRLTVLLAAVMLVAACGSQRGDIIASGSTTSTPGATTDSTVRRSRPSRPSRAISRRSSKPLAPGGMRQVWTRTRTGSSMTAASAINFQCSRRSCGGERSWILSVVPHRSRMRSPSSRVLYHRASPSR